MNKETLKLIIATREKFTEYIPDNRDSVTVSGFCRKSGRFGKNTNTYCHAGLTEYGAVGDLAIYTRHQGPTNADKTIDLFYKYLLYESPWSKVFIKPKVRDVIKDGKDKGFIIDTNQPNNLTAQACFASRMATENKKRLVSFYDLYHLFSNKDLAFLVSFFIIKSGKDFTISSGSYGHTHVPDGLSKKAVENFLAHNGREDELTVNKPKHVWKVNNSFGPPGNHLAEHLLKFTPNKSTESFLNIFDTKPKSATKAIVFKKEDFPALVKHVEEEYLN